MMTFNTGLRKDQGFTLVELAIVLIIIGLLIGGTLKGQELINGARVTATTAQIKALEAGTLTFQDTYNGFPGDLSSAATRLPNCTAAAAPHCALTADAGIGNGRIGAASPSANATLALNNGATAAASDPSMESFAYFNHLFNADLLDGIDGTNGINVGQGVLGAKLGSAKLFRIGYMSSNADAPGAAGVYVDATIRPGHYLYLSGNNVSITTASAAGLTNNNGITPSEAQRIDTKYDDGMPNTGNAFAVGTDANGAAPAAGNCTTAAASNSNYATSNRQNDCGFLIRFSN